jgi:hypothetical protein
MIAQDLLRKYINIVESEYKKVDEKWGKPTTVTPSERGKYKGRSIEDLRSSLATLKKSGPHKKGSEDYGRMRELQFAIRAKSGWGKVGAEEE